MCNLRFALRLNEMRLKIQLVAASFVLAGWCGLGSAYGAELRQATSLFEKPTYASKQLEVLPQNTPLTVTGHEVRTDDGNWIPVKTPKSSGWVLRDLIELTKLDTGYVTWPGKEHTTWIWGSLGGSGLSVSQFYTGVRATLGFHKFVNHHRRFFAGATVSNQFSDEKLTSVYDGKVIRYNTYLTAGYYMLPAKVFSRFGLGISPLAGANRDFMQKFGASALAELGCDVFNGERTRVGLSFSYEYTGKSRQSVNFVQDFGHCLFGGCDPSQSIPSASIFALNLHVAFAP